MVERRKIPSVNTQDENYRRLRYVRYADDFLLGFTGSKADAEEIKAEAKRRRDEKESKSKYYHENAKCNRNLEGNKIGKLKVIKLLSEKSGIDAEYLCRCDCGNAECEKHLSGKLLVHGSGRRGIFVRN